MTNLWEWLIDLLRHPGSIISWAGYPGLACIIFAETGAFAFFLPGDSLLMIAGMYAAKGDLNIVYLNALLIPMAILGDSVSYWLGRLLGKSIGKRRGLRWIQTKHMQMAEQFYAHHGGKAIVLARFVPIVRTFVPVVAGTANMHYPTFAFYNILGGTFWILSMTLMGYFVIAQFPGLEANIEKVIVLVILLSLVPGLMEYVRQRKDHNKKHRSHP